MDTTWECIVVGGGAAGLSAALVLGRARRRTLVIDEGRPSNSVADGIGGLLGNDRRSPADFYDRGREELAAYPSVELRLGEVVAGDRVDDGFVLELADGSLQTSQRVLLATGMDYRRPTLAGLEERWGHSVFHCPFCHGWEHRNEALAVLDGGCSGAHRALLLRMWSDDVALLTDGPAALEPGDAERLADAGVAVDERLVAGLQGPAPSLTAIGFADGSERPLGGLLVPVTMYQRTSLAEQLGAATQEASAMAADALAVDSRFQTSVPGLFAAGDAATVIPSVANAVASGNTAAATVVQSLIAGALQGRRRPSARSPDERRRRRPASRVRNEDRAPPGSSWR
jgi:thioredoxin reductase